MGSEPCGSDPCTTGNGSGCQRRRHSRGVRPAGSDTPTVACIKFIDVVPRPRTASVPVISACDSDPNDSQPLRGTAWTSHMTRQPKNEAFARTSFLHGANAAYIEEMQAQYERNPGSVSDEWRHFFASLQEEQGAARADGNGHGPSWARPLEQVDGRPRAAGRADRRLWRRREPHPRQAAGPGARRRLRAEPRRLPARHPGQHSRADADPRLPRDGPPGRRPRSPRPHRAQGPQGAAARDLRLHRRRPRPPDLHRQGAGPRDGDHPRDPEDPAPHLLPPHRRRVHAHHLAGAEVLDPGAHRGPRTRTSPSPRRASGRSSTS